MIATHPSAEGDRFFYVNPLLKREPGIIPEEGTAPFRKDTLRANWFWVSCCPTNVVRLLASLSGYFVTTAESAFMIHQYFTGDVHIKTSDRREVELSVKTDYPWDGEIEVEFMNSPGMITLGLRVPIWAEGAKVTVGEKTVDARPGFFEVTEDWAAGDKVTLVLPMRARILEPDSRINAIRDTIAVERGPLVYCAESLVSEAKAVDLDNFLMDLNGVIREESATGPSDVAKVITVSGEELEKEGSREWPFSAHKEGRNGAPAEIRLIPYYSWSNRGLSTMRVWIPVKN
jgi:DUF1680 family protein